MKKFTAMATGSMLFSTHVWLLLLLQCCRCWAEIPTNADTLNKTETAKVGDHCVVVLENTEVLKQIGAVWVSLENPCVLHACEINEAGRAHEIITTEDCGQFYCDVDSELRPKTGSCCGACVRTKCRYNNNVYDVGQTWHNNEDCTMLECTQLAGGQPIINAYQKTCAPLPPDCAPQDIYIKDCCAFCKNVYAPRSNFSESEEIWTEEYYRTHPCVRDCQSNAPAQTCYYKFVVEWYETLSKACYDCPNNVTDCERPHCIIGDGIPRSITVVNRMMPGPSIEVCENDEIVVDVQNHLLGESTTIHWHGMHQRQTPYMDGVPHISQCPISPHATFRYTFKAENAGTHFWHSHTGMQRGDGVFGALIVRRPRSLDPHSHLYDFDLSEHKMLVQDWVHVPGISMFSSHHHSRGDNKPMNLLINGRGRYYKAIWEAAKLEAQKLNGRLQNKTEMPSTKKPTIQSELPVTQLAITPDIVATEAAVELTTLFPDNSDDIEHIQPVAAVDQHNMRYKTSNEISRLARLARVDNVTEMLDSSNDASSTRTPAAITTENPVVFATQFNESTPQITEIPHIRSKRTTDDFEIPLHQIPLQTFYVRHGFRYRFRIINAEFLNCPIVVSIDNHTLTAINSDGYDFEAVDVGSIVTYAGERFDFVVNANQTIGNYWVRLKGLMDCSEKFTSAFQVALLRYESAAAVEPTAALGYQHTAEGNELNTMNRGSGQLNAMTVAELNALPSYDVIPGVDRDALKPVADYKFFVYYDFYAKDNPVFHPSEYYGFNANLSATNRLFTPQLNHISLKFPAVALLPSRDEIDDAMFCNETSLAAQGIDCRKQFCKCHHVLQVPLNSVVEFIIIDEGFTFDANHPFHLHGNAFRVVGLERLGANVTVEMVKQLDRYNLLKRNLKRPPIKDTVTVPDGGYTIVRFEAYNPGFWLFHCHIEFHAEIGMALVLKVGDNDEMLPVPKNFPTCNDYMPDMQSDIEPENIPLATITTTTTVENERSGAKTQRSLAISFISLILILRCIL